MLLLYNTTIMYYDYITVMVIHNLLSFKYY